MVTQNAVVTLPKRPTRQGWIEECCELTWPRGWPRSTSYSRFPSRPAARTAADSRAGKRWRNSAGTEQVHMMKLTST